MSSSDDNVSRDRDSLDVPPIDVPLTASPARPVTPPAVPPEVDLVALRERVLSTLQRRHRIHSQLAWILFGAGLAVLLVSGFIVSTLLSFLGYFFFENGPGFRGWFLIYLVLLVPLLIWQERRTRGGFFTFAMADVDLRRDPDSVGDFLLHRTQAHIAAYAEMLLWGPRAFLAGLRALRGARQEGLEMILPEAADTLTLMLSIGGGVKIKDLAEPGQDPLQLMPVLKWLDAHDYIGISSRGDRVWVSTPAKKMFGSGG